VRIAVFLFRTSPATGHHYYFPSTSDSLGIRSCCLELTRTTTASIAHVGIGAIASRRPVWSFELLLLFPLGRILNPCWRISPLYLSPRYPLSELRAMAETVRIVRPAAPNPNANQKRAAATSPQRPHFTWLLAIFTAWKSLLLVIAYGSPGPGYDTSTRVLFDQYDQYSVAPPTWLGRTVRYLIQDLTLRLTRWDALYFTTSSERGHLFEQEWAFSWFMARLTAALSNGACLYLLHIYQRAG